MLTANLVRVRRRGGKIEVPPLRPEERKRLLPVAEGYIAAAHEHRGKTRAEFHAACNDVPFEETDYKRVQGLRKLIEDRCTFEMREGVDPALLRKTVFSRASAIRQARDETEPFDAARVIEDAARELQIAPDEIEEGLFADLKENQRLTHFEPIGGPALLDAYERAQKQAVLLRAVKVVVWLRCPDAGGYRLFFRRLKFRRLLYTVTRHDDGAYRIEIDGPFSLFRAVTKYGLQLALLLPALEESGQWRLEAVVRWDKDRAPYRFQLEGSANFPPGDEAARLPDEVAQLIDRFRQLDSSWQVEIARDLLDLPGVGLCVPDLVFTHEETGFRVYLEVMGYWSREAVWRRVELVEAGLPHPILFAVSSRLRVSEAVLDEELPGQLYVYKGVMNAKAIVERLEAILRRRGAVRPASARVLREEPG